MTRPRSVSHYAILELAGRSRIALGRPPPALRNSRAAGSLIGDVEIGRREIAAVGKLWFASAHLRARLKFQAPPARVIVHDRPFLSDPALGNGIIRSIVIPSPGIILSIMPPCSIGTPPTRKQPSYAFFRVIVGLKYLRRHPESRGTLAVRRHADQRIPALPSRETPARATFGSAIPESGDASPARGTMIAAPKINSWLPPP
jgi:hypothetical protein